MNRIFIISLIFLTSSLIAQSFQVENKYEMIFRKSKLVQRNEMRSQNTFFINAPAGFKKIQIKFEINTLSGKKELFDPNKFYLVLESDKVRIRPVDFTYHVFMSAFESFTKLSQDPTEGKYNLNYNPEIKDSFNDYKIADYKDINTYLNFGSDKKPFERKTYSQPIKWKSNLINIYAIIPENLNSCHLYYGSQKLMLIEITE